MSAPAGRLRVLQPSTMVECVPFAARLSARACARRHVAGTPSGNGAGYPVWPRCRACQAGRERLEALRAAGVRLPRFLAFSPARSADYRAWMHRAHLEGRLERVRTIDD